MKIDGLPGMHAGDITVFDVEGDHQGSIDESVQWLLDNLAADASANHRQFTTSVTGPVAGRSITNDRLR